jgi:hypothetical protein
VLRVGGAAVLLLTLSSGCAVGRGPARFTSDDPVVKVPAITRAGEQKRKADLPKLVECLDDNDPAVRMFAIRSLQDLTGETLGYHYYDDDIARRPAVRRWREYAGLPVDTVPTTAPSIEGTPSSPTTAPTSRAVQVSLLPVGPRSPYVGDYR